MPGPSRSTRAVFEALCAPMGAAALREATGLSQNALYQALRRLRLRGLVRVRPTADTPGRTDTAGGELYQRVTGAEW